MNILIVGGGRSGEFVSTIGWPLSMVDLARPLEAQCELYSRKDNPPRERAYFDRYRLTDIKRGMYTVMIYALDGMTADQVVETWKGLQS